MGRAWAHAPFIFIEKHGGNRLFPIEEEELFDTNKNISRRLGIFSRHALGYVGFYESLSTGTATNENRCN
jgi:hypothetical protein